MSKINLRSQWTGQFFAAAELTRRGYSIFFTIGNVEATDLHAQSPNGVPFRIECKSTIKLGDSWLVKRVKPSKSHFFVFIYGSIEEPFDQPQFWISSSRKVARLYDKYISRNPHSEGKAMNVRPKHLGKPSRWEILPDYPST